MKTTPAGRPSLMSVGFEKTGPKPCARPTAQPNSAKPKMGCGRRKRQVSSTRATALHSETGTHHDDDLDGKEVLELGDVDPEEGKLRRRERRVNVVDEHDGLPLGAAAAPCSKPISKREREGERERRTWMR